MEPYRSSVIYGGWWERVVDVRREGRAAPVGAALPGRDRLTGPGSTTARPPDRAGPSR